MSSFCDLHTHSLFSDGTCTPKEIIDTAEKLGLCAVALCDHNTTDGLKDFILAAKNSSVLAVPGVEFSVDYNSTELHILGLFLPEEAFTPISELMKSALERKEKSNIDLIAALKTIGFDLNYEEIKGKTPKGCINRSHIAEEMVKKGYISSISEGLKTYLSKKMGYYREPERISAFEIIEIIKSLGGAPVLAHPFLNLTEEELIKFLPIAKEKGLVGMECYYSEYDEKTTETALELASKFGICPSGGSDFHGDKKPSIKLGVGKGNLKIPFEWAENIKKEI